MNNVINEQNYPIKRSLYAQERITNILFIPVMFFLLLTGTSFPNTYFQHIPDSKADFIVAGLIFLLYLMGFVFYWNNKRTFQVNSEFFHVKSRTGEIKVPMNCITGVEVPLDVWHRTPGVDRLIT